MKEKIVDMLIAASILVLSIACAFVNWNLLLSDAKETWTIFRFWWTFAMANTGSVMSVYMLVMLVLDFRHEFDYLYEDEEES